MFIQGEAVGHSGNIIGDRSRASVLLRLHAVIARHSVGKQSGWLKIEIEKFPDHAPRFCRSCG